MKCNHIWISLNGIGCLIEMGWNLNILQFILVASINVVSRIPVVLNNSSNFTLKVGRILIVRKLNKNWMSFIVAIFNTGLSRRVQMSSNFAKLYSNEI